MPRDSLTLLPLLAALAGCAGPVSYPPVDAADAGPFTCLPNLDGQIDATLFPRTYDEIMQKFPTALALEQIVGEIIPPPAPAPGPRPRCRRGRRSTAEEDRRSPLPGWPGG